MIFSRLLFRKIFPFINKKNTINAITFRMSLNDETMNDTAFINGVNNEAVLKNCYRMVIMGAPKVGKSSIVDWFLGQPFKDSYIPTIEDFHRKIFKIKGDMYRMDILDTSGNDPFPAMKKLNIMTGDIFVLVFSIDDVDSYVQVKQLCELIKELKKTKQDGKNCMNVPVLVLANKLDYMLENRAVQRGYDSTELQQQIVATNKSCVFYEVSCKSLIGLDIAFEMFFHQVNLAVEMTPSRHRRVNLNLDLTKPQFVHRPHYNTQESAMTSPMAVNRINDATNHASSNSTGAGASNSGGATLLGVERQGSGKSPAAKKSFRKMTFRKQLTEACGAVWLHARRPSIRAELKLLQFKNTGNFVYHPHQNGIQSGMVGHGKGGLGHNGGISNNHNAAKNRNGNGNEKVNGHKRVMNLLANFRNLFVCGHICGAK
jgi:small GTP-binding protein